MEIFFEEEESIFGNAGDNKVKNYNKLRFSSDLDLPPYEILDFLMLTIHISCVIKKDDKYYPEIHLEEALYVQDMK